MKKFLLLVFVFQFMMLNPNSVLSQCNTVTPGTIVMKRDSCISNKILLELQGHTTGTDVRYVWQIDDGSGGGWAPILGLDSFATRYSISMFDPQGKSIRVLVYCNSSGQFAYTTLFKYLYLDKRLEFSRIVCNPASSVGYDIYTKLTALNNINPITDTIYDIIPTYYAFTEGRDSMNFFDTHDLIGNVPYQRSNEFNLGGIFQRQVVFNWFSYCNENPLTQVPPRDMKWALDSLKLGIKNVPIIEDEAARDCVNDSLTLKLDLDDSFARAIQVTWFKKNVATNQTTTVGTSAKLKIRANVPLNDTFYASLSACGVTELSFPIVINNSVGTLTNTLLCTEDSILFDYSSRLQNINIFNPVYQFSLDSGALWFDIPEMLILDKRKPYRKVVKNNEIIKYRVVTKFCLESTDGVDTSNVVTHALSLNPKFEMTYFDCSNPLKKDSLKIKLNDSGSYTSYPIFSKKWYRQFHYDPIAVDVSSLFTGDSIMVKGQIGRNTYSIQYSLCPTSYNSLLLGRAGIFYPINPVADILSCQDSLTYRMLNDSTYLYDDTSTTK
ncbi:MAG: hypothetical protein MUE53_05380, partial [Chitinophagales bacterium]|nr:hypothetical protein [Chitinophagales bacterium]